MSIFTAAANDEDGDTIKQLREENEQLRHALLTANDTLGKVARAGALHAQAASCLRETVIRWAARAEQAEKMLEAIGAGGVGSKVARQDHHEQHLNMVPAGWKLVPEEPTTKMIDAARSQSSFPAGVWRAMLAAAPQPPVVEQPQGEQEPIGEAHEWGVYEHEYSRYTHCIWDARVVPVGTKLYTHPQPKREPLTEMEIIELRQLTPGTLDVQFVKFARAIERAHEIEGDA